MASDMYLMLWETLMNYFSLGMGKDENNYVQQIQYIEYNPKE